MIIRCLLAVIVLFTLLSMGYMCIQLKHDKTQVSFKNKIKLFLVGIISFIADGIGIGSFAINIALSKKLRLVEDRYLPAIANGAQVLPGAIEAFFFLKIVEVDPLTLISLIVSATVGGVIGGWFISKIKTESIKFTMKLAYSLVIIMLIISEFHILPIGGTSLAIGGYKLIIANIMMVFAGSLTAAGIGFFASVQALLFTVGLSPLAAFPIMTAAGAVQQPLSTMIFTYHKQIPVKKVLICTLGAIVGSLIALTLISTLNNHWLHGLLITVLAFNIYQLKNKRRKTSLPLDVAVPQADS